MRQTKKKLLCLLLAALLLFSLAACGKNKSPGDSNLIKIGDYELLYKSACIVEDSDQNDAVVLTLDFTNNSKENASYLWSVDETAMKDTTSEIKVTFEELLGSKNGTITIDPSTLSRETATNIGSKAASSDGDEETLLDWWNGDWYGWWQMTGCSGYYESMEGQWWDVCGVIDIGADSTGTVTLWDESYTKAEPMASAQVSLNTSGTGEHGTMMSEGGWFTNVAL